MPGCDRGAHPAQTGQLAPDFTVSDGLTTSPSGQLSGPRGAAQLLGHLVRTLR